MVSDVATVESMARAMGSVPAELLDCIQVNLAVVADHWHGEGTALRLGAPLRFDPRWRDDGLPVTESTADGRLADAGTLLGLDPADEAGDQPWYAIGDAFDLPWLPYHGRQHMEHSFLLVPDDAGATVLDAYHNDTPWGPARPCTHRLDGAGLDRLLAGALMRIVRLRRAQPAPLPPAAVLAANRDALSTPATAVAVDRYVAAYRGPADPLAAAERLSLETWLLARSRLLHLRWLQGQPGVTVPPAAAEHLRAWPGLAEQAYVALRRVQRGRPAPPATCQRLADLLHGDAAAARSLAESNPHTEEEPPMSVPDVRQPGVREIVVQTAAQVLAVDPATLQNGGPLTEVPSFSSFRVVEIIERAEEALGVELAAAELTPDNLHHLDRLCAVFERSAYGVDASDTRRVHQ